MTYVQFIIINIGALIAAAGGIFIKRLSDQLDHTDPLLIIFTSAIKNPNIWLGGICYVAPIFLWTYLLKYMELTKLQPTLSIVYLYTLVLAFLFLGEVPSFTKLLGIALIMCGIVIVGKS